MNSIKADDRWQMVEEKLEVLRGLTEERWRKEDWELATLGERTLRTVAQSKAAVEALKVKTETLDRQLQLIQELSP